MLWFGINQTRLLPGPNHWVNRLAHLAIGIGAMIVADGLARFIAGQPSAVPVREPPVPVREPPG